MFSETENCSLFPPLFSLQPNKLSKTETIKNVFFIDIKLFTKKNRATHFFEKWVTACFGKGACPLVLHMKNIVFPMFGCKNITIFLSANYIFFV
jgi:hypothetical protein